MGMFDSIYCKKSLPLSNDILEEFPSFNWEKEEFQTKDLENTMSTYSISKEGKLLNLKIEGNYVQIPQNTNEIKKWIQSNKFIETSREEVDTHFHGRINFYSYIKSKKGDTWDVEFDAVFTKGVLEEIIPIKMEVAETKEDRESRENKWEEIELKEKTKLSYKLILKLNKITNKHWSKTWMSVAKKLQSSANKINQLSLWVIKTLA